jgi:hypothetical protein
MFALALQSRIAGEEHLPHAAASEHAERDIGLDAVARGRRGAVGLFRQDA